MRWKWVVLAGLLIPHGAGCNLAYNLARTATNEPHVSLTKHAITHDLKKSARAAYDEARGQHPEHADSEHFREGFIDGYVDYLDRGGNGSIPAVPPAKYTRHTRYFTEHGQCLVKEYLFGFKTGQDTAIATGRRQFLTVPVLLPVAPPEPPAFTFQVHEQGVPKEMPQPRPPGVAATLTGLERRTSPVHAPIPAAPATGLATRALLQEIAKVAPPPEFDPSNKPATDEPVKKGPPPPEFNPAPMPEPERIAIPSPLLPVPAAPGPSGPAAWGDLPAIPPAPVPAANAPAAPLLPSAEGPKQLPPNHTVRPPLPPNHPQPRR